MNARSGEPLAAFIRSLLQRVSGFLSTRGLLLNPDFAPNYNHGLIYNRAEYKGKEERELSGQGM